MPATPKPRKLLFHIGHHKTGTTSIQYAFATDRVKLQGGRILYPAKLSHNYLRNHVDTYVRDGRLLPGVPGAPGLAALAERLQNGNFDVAVFSGENFERANPVELRQAMEEFLLPHVTDHAIICYVRPHAARILSSFSENLKLGLFTGSLDDFAKEMMATERLSYARNLAEWAETFGDHLRVRPMIRANLVEGDVLRDFIHTGFGPDAAVTITPGHVANESLCVEDLLVVKMLQDRLGSCERALRHSMGWSMATALAQTTRDGRPGTKLQLHKSVAETIRSAYAEDAAAMDARFFAGQPLFRNELDRSVDEALAEPQSLDPHDYFSEDALRTTSVLVSQIAMMLDNEAGNWSHFLRDRRIAQVHGEKPHSTAAKADRPQKKADHGRVKLGPRKKAGRRQSQTE